MKNKLKILIAILLFPLAIIAQSKTVTGVVNDDQGLPLPGVTVQVKGTNNLGAVTNFDGEFTISIQSNPKQILIFSYVGFQTIEFDVTDTTTVNLSMEIDTDELDEVVVIGYGSVFKKDVTGSISTVKVEDNIANQTTGIDQLLQGRAAGVQVQQNSSALGSGVSVRIRGSNSLRGNNEPLYVVDGIIIASAGEDVLPAGGVGNSGQEAQNGLTGINPRDIESIEILKDASATAIYGSRGANGVVLITTKKGEKGNVKINTFYNTSIRSIRKKYDMLDGVGYAQYQNESWTVNNANSDTNPEIEDRVPYVIDANQVFPVQYTTTGSGNNNTDPILTNTTTVGETPLESYDWQDIVYQESTSNRFGVSASGGSDNGNYYISGGISDERGIVTNSSVKSGDLRINLNQDLNKNLKLQARATAFFTETDFAESGDLIGSSNQSFVQSAIVFRPLISSGVDDFDEDLGISNPYSWINDFSDISKEKRFIGSIALTYKLPVKGLSYQFRTGGNVRTKDRRRFYGKTTFQGNNANGALQLSGLDATTFQVNNLLRYNRTFNRKHRINATVGVTYDVRDIQNSVYAVEDFFTTTLTTEQPYIGSVITTPLTYLDSKQQVFSYLGRLNYSYANRYVLTASFRRDGVSKFSRDNRYSFFPSFALAWNVSNESFLQNSDFVNSLKLRAGWGQIGNHGIRPYGTISNYGISSDVQYGTPTNGISIPVLLNNIANPDLKWETTEQLNFGLDFSVLDERISGTIDIYDKTTKDLLQNIPIPTSSGYSNILINKGNISNKGLELGLNFDVISNDNMELSIGGNIAFNRTKIESLGVPADDFYINGVAEQRSFFFGNNISRGQIFQSPANVFVEGEESSLFYGFETDGIYQTDDTDIPSDAVPGDVRIVDQNEDGEINDLDRTFIGNPNPDFIYGINLNFRYKRFNASVLLNGVSGNDIANGNLLTIGNAPGQFQNITKDAYYNAWRPDAPSNTHPRIGYNTVGDTAITDRIIEDGSFLRLNNVTIGYDLPVENNKLFERFNIFITAQNLHVWTNYSGYNPEISSFSYDGLRNGVDWNGSPDARNISFGVNINF
ncbi:MAG: TonB-dependent receptor [Flavobacteriaceae bacterium]